MEKMRIPIIAASLIKFGDLWEKGIIDLIRDSSQKVLSDAGIKSNEVDELYIANEFSSIATGQSSLSSIAFEETGISNSVCVNAGDVSGAAAIKMAANSILAGQSDIVMVLGAEKITDLKISEISSLASSLISQKEEGFIGATVQSQFAIMTRKYLHDFRLNSHELSFIPSINHKNAVENEFAQYQFELSEEKISSSPFIAEPIRLLEASSYCDGSAAIIMCSRKVSKKFSRKIKANLIASSLVSDSLALSKRKSITAIESTAKASKEAFEAAGIKQKDVDLMEVHDFVPITEVLAVEDMGFAGKGDGIKFIRSNAKKINLSGGLKGCGHPLGATGIRQSIDIVKKLKKLRLRYGITQTLTGTGSMSAVNIFSV